MRLQFQMYGEPNDRFTPEAADGMIGKVVPVNMPGRAQPCDGEVIRAEVVDDGRALLVTVEADVAVEPFQVGGKWSIRFVGDD